MMRYIGVTLLLSIAIATTGFAALTEDQLLERASREIIVKWRSLPAHLDAESALPAFASQIESIAPALMTCERTETGLERITTVRLSSGADRETLLSALRGDPRVDYAEPRPIRTLDNFHTKTATKSRRTLDDVPNDPFYPMQWGLAAIDVESAWAITRGDPRVAVAVVDLGVDFTHPELEACRWENSVELGGSSGVDDDGNGFIDDFYGYDLVDGEGDPAPYPLEGSQSHGTHIAGIIAAARNNGIGISGIAPECKVMAVRAGSGGSITYGYEGIYYACRAGAKIINCSWGGDSESAYERDVLQYALEHGCVVVVSAGNGNSDVPRYPAGMEGAMSVAATQLGDRAASFTHYGPWVKISAPGVAIVSTIMEAGPIHTYANWQGTSMSAPYVAAVCALVASRYPSLDGRAIMARVVGSADAIDEVNPARAGMLGLGRVNAWRALTDSIPGLRIGELTYVERNGNGDGRIRAGETAELKLSVVNDLELVHDAYAQIATEAGDVIITPDMTLFGDVLRGETRWNGTELLLELPPSSARGRVIPFSIEWFQWDGRLAGRSTVTLCLDSTFTVIGNDLLRLGFAENGSLGFYDYERGLYLGPGLVVGDHANALYHGSFLLAADGIVSDNGYGNAELSLFDWVTVPDSVAHLVPSSRADREARATFEDRQGEQQLFAHVSEAALAWNDTEARQFLVLEYTVANPSLNAWNTTYAGFFLDWDLGAASANYSRYDDVGGIAYVETNLSGYPLVGIAPIGEAWGSFYTVDNRAEIDPPADWSDAKKWEHLTSGIVSPPTDQKDVSQLVAVGPITIDAESERTFAFALVVGESVSDLRTVLAAARNRYGTRDPEEPQTTIQAKEVASVLLYPNPLRAGENLKLRLPEGERATVRIYNVLGQLVAEFRDAQGGEREITLRSETVSAASGLMFYRIETTRGTACGKLLVLK